MSMLRSSLGLPMMKTLTLSLSALAAILATACQSTQESPSYRTDDYLSEVEKKAADAVAEADAKTSLPDLSFKSSQPAVPGPDVAPNHGAGLGLSALLSAEAESILNDARRVEAYRLREQSPGATIPRGVEFDGFKPTGRGRDGDLVFLHRLMDVILDEKRVADWTSSYCSDFEPSMAFRVSSTKGSANLLISFECDELRVSIFDTQGKLVQELRADVTEDGGLSDLLALSQEAFPQDKGLRAAK